MTYATAQQMVDRFGERLLVELTDRAEAATGVIDADVLARALADTDAMIDGYLASRYRLPIASVPGLLTDLAMAIALYKLHRYEPDPKIKADHDAAVKSLREIATGVIKLTIAGIEPGGSGAGGVQAIDRERPLTPESLRGFI